MFNILINASSNLSVKKFNYTLDSLLNIYKGNFFFTCVLYNDQEYLYDSIENANYRRIRFCVLDKNNYPKLDYSDMKINNKFNTYNRDIFAMNAGLGVSPLIKTFVIKDDYFCSGKINLKHNYDFDKSIIFLKNNAYISLSSNENTSILWDVPFIRDKEVNNIFNYKKDKIHTTINRLISKDFGILDYLDFCFYKKQLIINSYLKKDSIKKFKHKNLLISKSFLSKSKFGLDNNPNK